MAPISPGDQAAPPPEPFLLTVPMGARLMRVSRRTIYRLIHGGFLRQDQTPGQLTGPAHRRGSAWPVSNGSVAAGPVRCQGPRGAAAARGWAAEGVR